MKAESSRSGLSWLATRKGNNELTMDTIFLYYEWNFPLLSSVKAPELGITQSPQSERRNPKRQEKWDLATLSTRFAFPLPFPLKLKVIFDAEGGSYCRFFLFLWSISVLYLLQHLKNRLQPMSGLLRPLWNLTCEKCSSQCSNYNFVL